MTEQTLEATLAAVLASEGSTIAKFFRLIRFKRWFVGLLLLLMLDSR